MKYLYLLNKYIKCNFRGWRCGTTTIAVVRRQRVKLSPQLSMPEVMLRTRYLINDRQLLSQLKLRCDLCYYLGFNLYQKDVPEMLGGKNRPLKYVQFQHSAPVNKKTDL